MKKEEYVLAALRSLGKESTGFEIAKQDRLLRHKRLAMGYGTLYLALNILVNRGILSSRWEELPPGETGPRRKYYTVVGGQT